MKSKILFIFNFKVPKAFLLCLMIIILYLLDTVFGYFYLKNKVETDLKALYKLRHYSHSVTSSEISFGDLDNGDRLSPRELVVSLDQMGFRNDKTVNKKEIIVIGDSFSRGGGVSNNYVVQSLLNSKYSELSVYNMSGIHPVDLLEVVDPEESRGVLCIFVERQIVPKSLFNVLIQKKDMLSEHVRNMHSISLVKELFGSKERGKNKYFEDERGIRYMVKTDRDRSDSIKESVVEIEKVSRMYKEKDVRFIFVPIPNKFSLKKLIERDYNGYLYRLYDEFERKQVEYIDIIPYLIKADYPEVYYWRDDTHFNPKGYKQLAKAIYNYLERNGL